MAELERERGVLLDEYYAAWENCSRDSATSLTFVELVVGGVTYMGRCVQVSGLIYGRQLFSIPDQIYLSDRFSVMRMFNDDPNPFRVGLESWGPELRFDDMLYEATIVGIVRDCGAEDGRWSQSVWARSVLTGGLVVSGNDGFCGWHGHGTVISPVEVQYGNHVRFPRRMGPEALARIGSIWEIESSNSLHSSLVEFAAIFLSDIQSGERGRFIEDEYHENAQWVDLLFDPNPQSPFYFLRSRGNDSQYAFFWSVDGAGSSLPRQVYPDENNDEQVAVCFCSDEDCTDRWPIAWFDVTPRSGQPYACVFGRAEWSDDEDIVIERADPRSELFRGASPFYEPEQREPD